MGQREVSELEETPDQAFEWALLEHWNEINAAAERKRLAELRYMPPPCDFGEDE